MVRAVPFGEGFIDYEAFFAGLVEGGFRRAGQLRNVLARARRRQRARISTNMPADICEWMREHVPACGTGAKT